jgi:cyclopropane fatty-acyl-phospholipid synthase-like methyltransferase
MVQAGERPRWVPDSVDLSRPSVARMYDYYLGGSHNFAIDREAARQVIAAVPDAPLMAQANRAFLRRLVRYLVAAGVRQFLDVGSGIPTVGNVHEIAQREAPDARVVYVDIDPVAVAHSRHMLAGNDLAAAIQADLRKPDDILGHPEVRRLLDFDEPVAVMIVAVLHYIPDSEDPPAIIARLRDTLAPGSYLALSQASGEGRTAEERAASEEVYRRVSYPLFTRGRADIVRMFEGFELSEPGVVWVSQWRPEVAEDHDDDPARTVFIGGLGCLR